MPTYTARWVLPVAGPPLAVGTVTASGDRITAVEPRGVRPADVDLGNVALIPGLVNAHTHLDLSGARSLTPPTTADRFTDWLRAVIAYRRGRSPEQVQADVRAGLAECLAAGTTLVGDITAGGASWVAVSVGAVRAVVFDEVIGLSAERAEAASEAHCQWVKTRPPALLTRPGTEFHAPYSVHHGTLRGFEPGHPFAVHLAETASELELLATHSGPFVPFLKSVGAWDATGLVPHVDRVLTASRYADLVLFVHCNYLDPEKTRYIAGLHTIVYCPRTHAAFGHPPHPFRDFLARGVRVCLGTDGLTSNPDLDILAEARFVAARYPDFPGDQLLRMVTLSGAEALGWADECGSLEPGKSADFVAVPLPEREGDVYELLFGEDCGRRRTWFRGTEHE